MTLLHRTYYTRLTYYSPSYTRVMNDKSRIGHIMDTQNSKYIYTHLCVLHMYIYT